MKFNSAEAQFRPLLLQVRVKERVRIPKLRFATSSAILESVTLPTALMNMLLPLLLLKVGGKASRVASLGSVAEATLQPRARAREEADLDLEALTSEIKAKYLVGFSKPTLAHMGTTANGCMPRNTQPPRPTRRRRRTRRRSKKRRVKMKMQAPIVLPLQLPRRASERKERNQHALLSLFPAQHSKDSSQRP